VLEAQAWLEQIKRLDEQIDAKIAEKERIRELMVNTVGSLDGMPRATGISDKVGNLTVKLISIEEELNAMIDEYVDRKAEVLRVLEQLPEREYGVLHRYYIRRMTWEQVADDIGYCTTQIWRIKKEAFRLLEDMLA
jgi:DNA-directed RNA polymerase specialized sigma subunit